ncbi:MAG: beta-Ala-His dipeptidase [Clostridia bacterium]|nr:beta-Ala-His dipeptidase [Clostridia bacterium]
MDFSSLSASRMLHFFEEISKIPRPSGHEEKIADYIEGFLKDRKIEYIRDAKNNVFAVLPATEGRENDEALMLQGHTDMVCEADEGKKWDVLTEGITLTLDGDWLTADGTPLGGDDGFAVAIMLAILDGAMKNHPRMEFLFTADEEVGLGGATAFDFAPVKAKKMVNLDSEEEDTVLVSCAGGVRIDVKTSLKTEAPSGTPLKISIEGLAGGHSGADIHLNRVNANVTLAKLLLLLVREGGAGIVSAQGGSKDNAITRSASAVIYADDAEKIKELTDKFCGELVKDITDADKGVKICCEPAEAAETVITAEDSERAAEIVSLLPYGVIEFNNDLGIVETSSNIGILRMDANGLSVSALARSQDDKKLDAVCELVGELSARYGAEKGERNRYPGWAYSKDSKLSAEYAEAYVKVFGKAPRICGIHAGLECGIFKKKAPDMDMISIGADMHDVHTPRERMSVSSCDRIWRVLCEMIEK